jgi:hypothetical protein
LLEALLKSELAFDALIGGVDAETQYANLIDFRITRFNDSVTRNRYFYSPFRWCPRLPSRLLLPHPHDGQPPR